MREKIVELFEYRRLPQLMEYGNGTLDIDFYEELILLQYDIYMLDRVLESSWDTDIAELQASWDKIHGILKKLGVNNEDVEDYCKEIKTYENHELAIRDRVYPHDLDMYYFYYFKSCDVKLIRRLIYDRYPTLQDLVPLEDWKVFDYITEIDDDVEDVLEDLHTINGNGYLISKLINGNSVTQTTFKKFLQDVASQNIDKSIYPEEISPYLMTLQILPDTMQLLENRKDFDVTKALICDKIG